MTEHTVAIAPIPLARSMGRMLAVPALLLMAGVAAVAGGANVGGLVGVGLVAAGLVVAVLSLYLAVMLLSVRLDVEVATLHLRWLGGERRYMLVRGPVTRVALAGDEAARLRPRFGALGWAVGHARLRRDEQIDIVRLAPTASMILVPTDRGRLGIAPASEEHLLSALAAAARIQQRLDEVAERARAFMDLPPAADTEAAHVRPEPAPPPDGRRMLTGIERQLLEERMAAERAATLQRAEAERLAAIQAAEGAAMVAVPDAEAPATPPPVSTARQRRRGRWRMPAWLASRRAAKPTTGQIGATLAALDAAEATPAPAAVLAPPPLAAPEPAPAAAPIPVAAAVEVPEPSAVPPEHGRAATSNDQLLAFGLALTPVIGAGAIWLIAFLRGDLSLSVEALRPIALALLAIGPAGALGALAARAWYPRLQGLVTVTALTGLVLVGRVLLG